MDSDEIDYGSLFNLFKKHFLLIFLVVILFLTVDMAVTLTMPKTYSATATLILGEKDNLDREASIIGSYLENSINLKYNSNVAFDINSNKIAKTILIKAEGRNPTIAKNAANDLIDYYLRYANSTRLKVASETTKDLQDEIDRKRAELTSQYASSKAYKERNDLTKDEKKEYDALLGQIYSNEKMLSALPYKQAESLKQAYESINAIEYVYAKEPENFSSPNILFNLGLGIFISLFIALFIAQVKETLKEDSISRSHVESLLDTDVLAVLPTAKHSNYFSDRFVEPIKSLNSYLRKTLPGSRLLFVTAPVTGSGTTLITLNMAIEMAKQGKKILLIDGNIIGKPALSKLFSKTNALGFSDFLLNQSQMPLTGTTQENLFVMLSGTKSHRDLFTDNKIKDAFKEIKKKNFDYILIDGINLSKVESRHFATNADAVLIVADAKGKKKDLLEAKHTLSRLKANLIGIVLNKYDS